MTDILKQCHITHGREESRVYGKLENIIVVNNNFKVVKSKKTQELNALKLKHHQ